MNSTTPTVICSVINKQHWSHHGGGGGVATGHTPTPSHFPAAFREGFGLWACLPDPKRALGAHGVPRFGEVRLRHTALTLELCGARAGYTPPSADVLVLAWGMGHGARHMLGTEPSQVPLQG